MSDTVIRVDRLSKLYRIGRPEDRYKTLRESIAAAMKAPFRRAAKLLRGHPYCAANVETIWALKNVTFEVKRGEVIGIIGRNGAGKTTLLKILSRITEPTEGYAEIRGRIGSLLEVGTGFHPELTGRENIYLNGAILGMKKEEIERKFDDIVAFAEVEKFIDTPVKHYSSGMYVRLAFAVAAHLEPEILMVDEVLAVGDAAFQEKCLGQMGEVARGGRTVLFVSHNMAAIESLCSRAILLKDGQLVENGLPEGVIQQYLVDLSRKQHVSLGNRMDRQGNGRLRLIGISLMDSTDKQYSTLATGQEVKIVIEYEGQDTDSLNNVSMAIGFYDIRGQFILYCENEMVGSRFRHIPSRGKMVCSIDRLPLSPGMYYLNLYCEVNDVLADWIQRAYFIAVVPGDFFGTGKLPPPRHGGLLAPHDWAVVCPRENGHEIHEKSGSDGEQ